MKRLVVLLALGACGYPEPKDRCDGTCAVYAIDQPIALPGSVITLEGTFDRDTIVTFPGTETAVRMDSYGPHRITVKVPNDATTGGLVALTNTASTEPVAFRTVTFRPELQAFRSTYEQTDVGRFLGASPLFQRTGGTAVAVGPRVFMIGGSMSSGAASSTIDSMVINADDTLSDPTSSVATLSRARTRHASVVVGPYVYAIGGADAAGPTDSVEGTQLDDKFRLGTFGNLPGDVTLTVPREGLAAAVIGNYVYVIGGKNDGGELATLERAPIYEAGLLGDFEAISGIELLTGRSGHSLAVAGNFLYVIGGSDGGTPLTSIERLELFPDGYIGAPTVVGTLSVARSNHVSVVVGDSIYVIGGEGPAGATTSVERIPIDDSLVPQVVAPLHDNRTGAMIVSAGNHVYVMGGSDLSGVPITTFERASIIGHATVASPGVTLDDFADVPGTKLRLPVSYPATLVLGNTLYVIGGGYSGGATTAIDMVTINPDGTLGELQASGLLLQRGRIAPSTFIYNNDFYVVGGRTSGDFTMCTETVERAHIGADGTLGPFELLGLTLDVPRGYLSTAVINRSLFAFAGVTNGSATSPNYVDTVKTTPADTSTGILAPFSTHSSVGDGRAFHRNLVLSSKIYLLGGLITGGLPTPGIVAPISPAGGLGTSWTDLVQNLSSRQGGVLIAAGDAVFAIGGVNASGLRPTQRTVPDAADDLTPFVTPTSGSLAKPRFGHAAVTIGNRIYVLGGTDNSILLDSFEVTTIR